MWGPKSGYTAPKGHQRTLVRPLNAHNPRNPANPGLTLKIPPNEKHQFLGLGRCVGTETWLYPPQGIPKNVFTSPKHPQPLKSGQPGAYPKDPLRRKTPIPRVREVCGDRNLAIPPQGTPKNVFSAPKHPEPPNSGQPGAYPEDPPHQKTAIPGYEGYFPRGTRGPSEWG